MATVCSKCQKSIPYANAHSKSCEDKIGEPVKAAVPAPVAAPARIKSEQAKAEEDVKSVEEVDYLRKYQYRKDAVFGSVASDPIKGSKAERQKRILLAQPRVRMIVPRKQDESPKVLYTVNINGYRLDFPKNDYIDVPKQIADVIIDSQKQTDTALSFMRIADQKELV